MSPDQTILMSPFGIFGLIKEDESQLAHALIKQRLMALDTDIDGWTRFSDKDKAHNDIAAMQTLLKEGVTTKLLQALCNYETNHDKVGFCKILTAKFVHPEQYSSVELFKPFSLGFFGWITSEMRTDIEKAQILTDMAEACHEIQTDFLETLFKTNLITSPRDLVTHLTLTTPASVISFLKSACIQTLGNYNQKMKVVDTSLSTKEEVDFQTNVAQLKKLSVMTHTNLQAFIEEEANTELYQYLTTQLVDAYVKQLFLDISTADFNALTGSQLNEITIKADVFKRMRPCTQIIIYLTLKKRNI